MKRKVTVHALCAMLFALCVSAEAQQPKNVYRIGVLSPRSGIEPNDEVFRQQLREFGYVEGQNLLIEWRFSKGKQELYHEFAADLVRLRLDCIVVSGIGAAQATKQATSAIPIVMSNASDDPVRQGLISSLARPGGNITGFTDIASELAGKRLELLKEAFPKISRVAHLSARANAPGAASLKEIETAARWFGVRVQALELPGPDDLENAFRAAVKGRADGLIVAAHGFINSYRERIVNLTVKNRLPSIYTNPQFVLAGGLMSYAADITDQYRRTAIYVDKILKGTKPVDLPVEQPKKFELVINLKSAKQIGVTIPQSVLYRADKVIK
ncbi:MAG TPA: ABC transporter substrate-binding protein [Candidatus Binatia bacterium]|nr:ABC transporter substrate-binding protein [Candidatus Binatia bacterium]